MQYKYRYYIDGSAPVTVRGVTIKPTEFFYSNVRLFTVSDLSANPSLRVDTDENLDGTWVLDILDDDSPAEVTGLAGVVDPTKVVLSWTDPTIADFKEIVITHDQTGGDTPVVVAKGVQTRSFTGLTNAQAYVFTVKTKDNAGNTSTGVTITKTPATDSVAPAEVTQRNATRNPAVGSGQVLLEWVDPTTADFDHVQITHDQDGATYAVATLTITSPPTTAETWDIALFGGDPVSVSLLGTEDADGVATAIRAATFTGYDLTGTGAEVVFTRTAYVDTTGNGVLTLPAESAGAGTFGTPVQGVAKDVFNVPKNTRKLQLSNLTPNVDHVFTIKSVDRAGNLSSGVTLVATPK